MKRGVYLLPNGLTLGGMFFGFYSIIASINGSYTVAAWSILIATVFDGLDGWVARLTNTSTRFGIELDSLSDLVAFGVAPAVMVFNWAFAPFGRVGWVVAFLYVSCGALRLARYNVQMVSTEKKYFTGMPIPGAAMVLCSVVIFYHNTWQVPPGKSVLLLILTVVLAALMISTLRFHGFKELDLTKRKPFVLLVLLVIFVMLVVVHPPYMIFGFAMIYLTWGIIENMYTFYRRKRRDNNLPPLSGGGNDEFNKDEPNKTEQVKGTDT
ncbi:MAG: CDP-diacylglycerol--serine O-phosphatidyltransferase [Candidatus Magnetoovum sp. WYHC-5]|nr:CDP-diacylglycerol--serine O-phosphatidyltransferase [Candidatus Magnetoovum sp. WYHC-5]